jgi:TolB protein
VSSAAAGLAFVLVCKPNVLAETEAAHVVAIPLQQQQQQPPPPPQQQVLDLDAIGKGKAFRLAVQDFTVEGGDKSLIDAARVVTEVLWADLDFEKEFYLIQRKAHASIPVAPTPDALPFDTWAQAGADGVVMATLRPAGNEFQVDLRVILVRGEARGKERFASSFQHCTTRNPRACAHFIADTIHKQIRGLDGVAQTRLAFASDRDSVRMSQRRLADGNTSREIYIADYDGFNQRAVTANRTLSLHPTWAPDGRTLAYTSWLDGFEDVYINTLDGKPFTRPVRQPGSANWTPAFSPDGMKIAFSSNRSGDRDIWVYDRNTRALRNITNTRGADSAPTWSPDGSKIAFTSDRSGGNHIYIMNADGTAVNRITQTGGDHDRPTWSPLGFIAYNSGSAPGHNVSVYDLVTGQTRVITDGIGDNASPAIAPNGRHVAFATTRWGRWQIAIISYDGQHLRQITRDGSSTSPSWSRSLGR